MASRYWVGGTGNWDESSTTHWSETSGGSSGASSPTISDDIKIDGNSGTGTITLTFADTVLSVDFTGYTGTFAGSSNLTVRGNFTFSSGMTQSWTGTLSTSTNTVVITSNGKSFLNNIIISSTTSLGDSLITTGNITTQSDFNDGGFNITCVYFRPSVNPTITFGAGTLEMTGSNSNISPLFYVGAGSPTYTVNAAHTLKFTNTSNNQLDFDTGNSISPTFGKVWFARGASTGLIQFYGNMTFAGSVRDTGTANHSMYFAAGKTVTLADLILTNGTRVITISSSFSSTSTHALTKSGGGTISCDYLNIQHSVASPASTFYAGTHSTDNQATASAGSGWTFTDVPVLDLSVSVSDSITLTESVTETRFSNISVSDSITITESVTKTVFSNISVSDSITITESITKTVFSNISVSDDITLTENITIILIFSVSVFDQINVTENITITNGLTVGINITDLINITENVTLSNSELGGINVLDLITITENTSEELVFFLSVFDGVTISENTNLLEESFISVFSGITLTENITTNESISLSVNDSITLTENILLEYTFFVSVFDGITISETNNLENVFDVGVFDTIIISENYSNTGQLIISIFDSINITESVTMESFRFSPSIRKTVGRVTEIFPNGGIRNIGNPPGGIRNIGRPSGIVN